MTKTENLNLPQFAADDPFQRTDFNEAFAVLDAGYADTQSVVKTTEALQTVQTVLGDQLEDSYYHLCRLLLHGRRAGSAPGEMPGMACNTLSLDSELLTLTNFAPLDGGGIWVGKDTTLTMDMLNATASDFVNLAVEAVDTTGDFSATFSAPLSGTITKLQMWFDRTSNNVNATLNLKVKLYDLTTGAYTYTSSNLTFAATSSTTTPVNSTFTIAAPVAALHRYRIEVTKSGITAWCGTIGLGTKDTPSLIGTVTSATVLTTTAEASIPLLRTGTASLALVQYSGSGTVAVTVGGQTMALQHTRSTTAPGGAACTEALYRQAGNFSGTPTVAVTISATASQRLELYGFGGVIL